MYTHINLPVNAIVRPLPHSILETGIGLSSPSWQANSQLWHDTRVLKPPSLPNNLKVKGIEPQQDEPWVIYTKSPVNAIFSQPHHRSRDSQDQKKFLAAPADKQTHNYEPRVLKTPHVPTNPKVKGNGEKYIQIYQEMILPDYPIVVAEIARARKHFSNPLLTSKPTIMNQECSSRHPHLSL